MSKVCGAKQQVTKTCEPTPRTQNAWGLSDSIRKLVNQRAIPPSIFVYGFGQQVFITCCFAPQAFDIPYFSSQAMNIQHFGLQAFSVHCFGLQAPGVCKHLTHIFFYSQALVLVNLARESLTSGVLDNKPLECAFGSRALAWLYTGVLTLNFWCTGRISIHQKYFTNAVVDVSRGGERWQRGPCLNRAR